MAHPPQARMPIPRSTRQARRKARQPFPLGRVVAGIVLGLGLVALAVFVIFPKLVTQPPNTSLSGPVAVGQSVPDFSLTLVDGTPFRLSEHQGRVVVFYTMAGWCASCIPGTRTWAQLYPEYHQRGIDLVMLSVEPTETPQTLAAFEQQAGISGSTLPWAIDRNLQIARLLGVQSLDQTIIIDRQGRLAYSSPAPLNAGQLRQILDQVLGGK